MDYTRYVIQEQLQELRILQKYEVTEMMYEAAFLESCYETGIIGVLEATKDSLFKGLIDALKQFFANLKSMFKKRSIELYEKRFSPEVIQALRDNIDTLQANARKLQPRKDVPFWKGDVKSQQNELIKSVNDGIRNINTNNVKDYTYGKPILGNDAPAMLEKQDTAMTEYLKNYFRYGVAGDAETRRETISGTDIANKLSSMIDYIAIYNTTYADIPGKTSDKIVQALDKVKLEEDERKAKEAEAKNNKSGSDVVKSQPTTDSLRPDLFLSVENKYVYETLLPIMVNYSDVVTEGKKNKNKTKSIMVNSTSGTNNSKNDDNNDKKDDEPSKNQKEVEKAKEKEKDMPSVTSTNSEDPEADKEVEKENKDAEKEAKLSSKEYFNSLTYFAKMATTAYQTSIEERFLYYANVLEDCGAKEYEKKPEEVQQQNTTKPEPKQEPKKKKGLFGKKKK